MYRNTVYIGMMRYAPIEISPLLYRYGGVEFSDDPKSTYVCIKYLYAHAEAHVNLEECRRHRAANPFHDRNTNFPRDVLSSIATR